MPKNPIGVTIGEPVSKSLEHNLGKLSEALRIPQNADVIVRKITISGFEAALIFIDGMVSAPLINLHVMEPIMKAKPYVGGPSGRTAWLNEHVLTVSGLVPKDNLDDVMDMILTGDAALLVDGCAEALIIDAKGYERRNVERPVNETVIVGPHEAFVESMKINITLIRRIIKSPRLIIEKHEVGTGIKTTSFVLYLDGVANQSVLKELRRRMDNINVDFVMTAGELEQLIEDSPFALVPQMIRTERPDRAASFLISGMVIVFVEGSPVAMGIPATMTHLLHTPDLSTMRFPYGAFKRTILNIGLVLTAFLPALYLSLIMFHNEVLPLALMTSIYETQSRVPIPILYELVFMGIAFDLILEAGARMPGVLSNGLGVISAIILGQAVVAADLVSPLMVIVVSVSGLGSLIVPEHSLSIGLRMLQATLIFLAAVGGLFAVLLASMVLCIELCQMTSMGVPLYWAHAPERMHNPDVVGRYPIWQQRIRMYLSAPEQLLRARGRMRAWDTQKEKKDGKR